MLTLTHAHTLRTGNARQECAERGWLPYELVAQVPLSLSRAPRFSYYSRGSHSPTHLILALSSLSCASLLDTKPIIVNILDEEEIDITGIIDWDSGHFTSAAKAFRPPLWLWTTYAYDEENETFSMVGSAIYQYMEGRRRSQDSLRTPIAKENLQKL